MKPPALDLSLYGFDRFGPDDVVADPFPHIFVPGGAIPESTYDYLLERFPPVELFVAGRKLPDNKKIHATADRILRGDGIDECWATLARAVAASDVFDQLMRIFEPWVEERYPEIAARHASGEYTAGWRNDRHSDIALDQQVSCHAPVRGEPRSDRGPHVRHTNKLFVCSVFMPCEPEPGEGGDMLACRRKPGNTTPFGKAQTLSVDDVEFVDRLPYARNAMSIYLNTPDSIEYHTPRAAGPHPFRYFQFEVETRKPLFDLPMIPGHDAWWRRLARPVRAGWWRLTAGDPGFAP